MKEINRFLIFLALFVQLDKCCWECDAQAENQNSELVIPEFSSEVNEIIESFVLVSLGYQLCHFDVRLGLKPASVEVLGRFLVQFTGELVVEEANADDVESHKEADTPVDGDVDNNTIADTMSIRCKSIKSWPPAHPPVDNEGKSKSLFLVVIDQVLVVIAMFLSENSFFEIIFLDFCGVHGQACWFVLI